MIERRDDVDYLRCKAAQFRKLAAAEGAPLSAKLIEIAEALEEHAAEIAARAPLVNEPLSSYRVYFRTSGGAIAGREEFEADGDWSALMIASALFEACADICTCFELWNGARRVDKDPPRRQPDATLAEFQRRAEETVIKCEMAMRDSEWTIAKSKRLLDRINKLTEERGGSA